MDHWWGFGWWRSGPFSNNRRMDGQRGNPDHIRRPKGKFCKKYADSRQKPNGKRG